MTPEARRALLNRFRWVSGHADVWRVFADPDALAAIVGGLVAPWRQRGVTHVVGIEARGFLLGGAAAVQLGAGFVAVRKSEGLLPGDKVTVETATDYRGQQHTLRMQAAVLGPSDRVLLVDDWAERGSQARGVRQLVTECGATFLGVSLLVDQLADDARPELGTITAVVRADELGPDD
jgi:adenine phosphoribosyltransferase